MRQIPLLPLLLLPVGLAQSACETHRGLLLRGGRIYVDAASPPVEALLIVDGRVRAAGTEEEVQAALHPESPSERFEMEGTKFRELDLGGAVAVPGLIDAHGHVANLGALLENLDLGDVKDAGELVERVRERARATPKGEWILGRGWDQTRWPGQAFPDHAELSRAVPDHPVFLSRVDGHAALVNERALALAGVAGAREMEGGRVLVDGSGRPTGVLIDEAMGLVSVKIPPSDASALRRRLLAAQQHLFELGIVGVHDMGMTPAVFDAMTGLAVEHRWKLKVAVYAWANEGLDPDFVERARTPLAPYFPRLVGAKLMVDGALGSRGAALLADYADAPGERGLPRFTSEEFMRRLDEVADLGLQPATHAIGDAGNRLVLDAYAARAARDPKFLALRPRVEHAQVVAPEDWSRFAELGVVPSVQPTHATSDMRWAEARLGPARVRGAYAWRRLAPDASRLALGSDFPVEDADPRLGLHAARTRQDADGRPPGGWQADQALSGAEALAGFTSGAAYAAGEERSRGKLLPGFDGDVTVLSVDPVACDPRELLEARVRATIVRGEIVHSRLRTD
jgi:hypothetical protein